uniref:Uncharacterized protein n=1 Tax=Cajanus cajan TaxID=3821 RepID=A0A151TPA7_CAJCA|nr:hypothetical protein KK1_022537 [Cajanus cajan]
MLVDLAPKIICIPKNYYEAKKEKIDFCVDGCMLYYKEVKDLTKCKFCRSPSQMRWHHENKNNSIDLRHPCDGEAWKHFDHVYLDFASEPQNIRLGLCSDGFTPYVQASTNPYSCWPVIVMPYNLPLEMCMTKPYFFLTCLIPGLHNLTVKIDVYLQPLIDDLKLLWDCGVLTYDISTKQNFILHAALSWTINDFSAYGMLSGWGTKGKLACPHCMADTKAFQLDNGVKSSWFDCL